MKSECCNPGESSRTDPEHGKSSGTCSLYSAPLAYPLVILSQGPWKTHRRPGLSRNPWFPWDWIRLCIFVILNVLSIYGSLLHISTKPRMIPLL